jgi:hypothetical protein
MGCLLNSVVTQLVCFVGQTFLPAQAPEQIFWGTILDKILQELLIKKDH